MVSTGWSSLGYATTMLAEYNHSYTSFEFVPEEFFDTVRSTAPQVGGVRNVESPLAPFLQQRAFHPAVVQALSPGSEVTGGLVAKEIPMLGLQTPTEELPWEKWLIKVTDKTELAGFLRVVMLSTGYTVDYRPSYAYAPSRAGSVPIVHRTLESLDGIPPRLSDTLPMTTTLAQDPYWYYRIPNQMRFFLDAPPVDNERYPFMKPIYQNFYHLMERMSTLPPTCCHNRLRIMDYTANPNPQYGFTPTVGYAANVGVRANRNTLYSGMLGMMNTAFVDADGHDTMAHTRAIVWFSKQASMNAAFQRSIVGWEHSSQTATTIAGTFNGPIQGPAGQPNSDNFNWEQNTAGLNRNIENAFFSVVCKPDAPGAMPPVPAVGNILAANDNPHLRLFYSLFGQMQARHTQWYMKLNLTRPLVLLGDMAPLPLTSIVGAFDPNSDNQANPGGLSMARFLQRLAQKMGTDSKGTDSAIPIEPVFDNILAPPTSGPRRQNITFASPVVAPIETAGVQHFNSGLNATAEPDEAEKSRQHLINQIEKIKLERQLAELLRDAPPQPAKSAVDEEEIVNCQCGVRWKRKDNHECTIPHGVPEATCPTCQATFADLTFHYSANKACGKQRDLTAAKALLEGEGMSIQPKGGKKMRGSGF
jgi:hypothetical protein